MSGDVFYIDIIFFLEDGWWNFKVLCSISKAMKPVVAHSELNSAVLCHEYGRGLKNCWWYFSSLLLDLYFFPLTNKAVSVCPHCFHIVVCGVDPNLSSPRYSTVFERLRDISKFKNWQLQVAGQGSLYIWGFPLISQSQRDTKARISYLSPKMACLTRSHFEIVPYSSVALFKTFDTPCSLSLRSFWP